MSRKRKLPNIPNLLVFLPDDIEEAEDLLWLAGPFTGQLGECTFAGSLASRFIVGVSSTIGDSTADPGAVNAPKTQGPRTGFQCGLLQMSEDDTNNETSDYLNCESQDL